MAACLGEEEGKGFSLPLRAAKVIVIGWLSVKGTEVLSEPLFGLAEARA